MRIATEYLKAKFTKNLIFERKTPHPHVVPKSFSSSQMKVFLMKPEKLELSPLQVHATFKLQKVHKDDYPYESSGLIQAF